METTSVISDEDRQDMLSLHHAALKIHSEIKSMTPFNNCGKTCKKEAESLVPQSLQIILQILFTGIQLEGEKETENETLSQKVLIVAQDIVTIVAKGSVFTPKHVGIGVTVHQATRKTRNWLIFFMLQVTVFAMIK